RCPYCGGEVTEERRFNLMFKTFIGPVEDQASIAYLRPETAGGIFVNFKNVQATTRKKLPFGIAQIGKGFRNEITPGKFIFRDREFEMMEIEYFCRGDEAEAIHQRWIQDRIDWYVRFGLKRERLSVYHQEPDKDGTRVVLRLHPALAPYKVAVLPLSKKETLTPLAREIAATLRKHWMVTYDETQAIGRRYRRQDEIGTPFCVTVDFDS